MSKDKHAFLTKIQVDALVRRNLDKLSGFLQDDQLVHEVFNGVSEKLEYQPGRPTNNLDVVFLWVLHKELMKHFGLEGEL